MKSKPVAIDVNLVPKDPFFDTAVGKILRWALSIGRYIVMFTELIVVLSFVTRFYLDRKMTDVNKQVSQKKAVIKSYADFEKDFRDLQEKAAQYEQVVQQENIVDTFPLLAQVIPDGINLDELVLFPDKISLSGTVISQQSLNVMINNLQISPDFSNVVVSKIEAEGGTTSSGFTFSLTARTGVVISEPMAPKNGK